jgi:hypothetical protein
MIDQCLEFRRLLDAHLCGEPPVLGWHEHLTTCESCLRLLEEEENLDQLLASVPAAELPPSLAQRVVAEVRLDLWLEAADEVRVPDGLAQRVLAGVRAAEAPVPLTLVESAAPVPILGGPQRFGKFAAAAAVVIVLGGMLWRNSERSLEGPGSGRMADVDTEALPAVPVEDDLLAQLDMLEQLDLAESLDPVALDALVFLDVSDEYALDWSELDLDEEVR